MTSLSHSLTETLDSLLERVQSFPETLQSLPETVRFRWQRAVSSLRTQLIFWNIVALSLLLGGLGVVCRYITLSFMIQSVDDDLERGVAMYLRPPRRPPFEGEKAFQGGPPPFDREDHGPPGPPPFESAGHPPDGPGPHGHARAIPGSLDTNNPNRPRLYTNQGQPFHSNDTAPAWDAIALAHSLRGETLSTTVWMNGDPLRVLSTPGFNPDGKLGAVQNAYPLKEVYRTVSGINSALLLLIPVGLFGAGWVGASLTRRVLRRMHWMTQAAERISAEDFSRRLPVSGNDEFSELARTFNGLLGRLDRAYQEQRRVLELQRRFTADASHELKTPLTIIKVGASLALGRASTDEGSRHTFREIDDAALTMSNLVQDLLLLARSDGGQMARNPVEILVREVLEMAQSKALCQRSAPIALRIEPEELSVMGSEAELVRLFRNLLDNAIRYTPAEGCIRVTAHALEEKVVITVEDTGEGIAPQHLPHLGERFYRVDASRTRPTGGTGLGLSICKSIVEAHGGTIAFASRLGVGTRVTVTLPAASPDPLASLSRW